MSIGYFMTLDKNDEELLAWLRPTDVSINHMLARKKHEPTTGKWFLKSGEFMTWSNASKASLWLYGKPGSGKTILCSSIIEHIIGLCNSTPSDQYAYFYFDFNQKWNGVDMLRSIIAQLCTCKKTVPREFHQLYQECKSYRSQVSQTHLLKAFPSLLANSYRTFIILDALDECPAGIDRTDLLNAIKDMIDSSSELYLNILVTSRRERDIAMKFTNLIDNAIGLEESVVDSDIALYVRRCIRSDQEFQEWDDDTKKNMEQILCKKANGMYDVLAYIANDDQVQVGRMSIENTTRLLVH